VGLQGGLQGLTAHGRVVPATKTPVVSLLLMGFSVERRQSMESESRPTNLFQ
jgi:hypothetical protein